jgi:hypothetical protein
VAKSAVALRGLRVDLLKKHNLSLRELYRTLEKPGAHPLKDAHEQLDEAVRSAYGMASDENPIQLLFDLNQELAALEADGKAIGGPGLPVTVDDPASFISDDKLAP